ncbi:MAG TPA: formate--tetrahydrofolate ligase [Candidatus Dormibacteraeota bacterium]|nr:formate--tetrahydrofolate ligase [Candidatus Dormibacteraeota bacterium]
MSQAAQKFDLVRPQRLRPVMEVGKEFGLLESELISYGPYKAKISLDVLKRLENRPDGRLVVVTAITPTRAGEGKTTSAIGLTEGLGRIGANVALCLRQPSTGPLFGIKGGGTGGGMAQIVPMEEINLHFTGDIHAVEAAHNLLAAVIDSAIFHGQLEIGPSFITWPRTLDVNDRALRHIVTGLGGDEHGVPRESSFIIAAASEIMAILALASDLEDLRRRVGRIIVGQRKDGSFVTAEDLRVAGAMTVLLRDALLPNIVQTMEGQPTLVHAGPFGNIAHGNNSLLADQIALKLADIVVTEAGFGADLGLEKFAHIVARYGHLKPAAALVVATVRALKSHGGVPLAKLGSEDVDALRRGAENLAAHIDIVKAFGMRSVVAINRFPSDTDRELDELVQLALQFGADAAVVNDGFGRGGDGAVELAHAVEQVTSKGSNFAPLYPEGTPIREQILTLAQRVYGAADVEFLPECQKRIDWLTQQGMGALPVCMSKTHLSLSHDPSLKGRPRGFTMPIRNVYPSAGAGFIVALAGDIQLMPGLGKEPAYTRIDIDADGTIRGLT